MITDDELKELKRIGEDIATLNDDNLSWRVINDNDVQNFINSTLRLIDDLITQEQQKRAVTDEDIGRAIKHFEYSKKGWESCLETAHTYENDYSKIYKDHIENISVCLVSLRQMQGWIPVSTPPKKVGSYPVILDCGIIDMYFYSSTDEWFHNNDWAKYEVTHWMPLPESPKAKGEKE